MAETGIKIDTSQFRAVLKEYMQYTKRDIGTILDTKGFYISRGAVRETTKASAKSLKSELGRLVHGKGGDYLRLKNVSVNGRDAPLAALIVNKRAGKGKGFYGQRMTEAILAFLNARLRSIAFEKSGFIPAIKKFEPLAERKGSAPRAESNVKQYGKPKGSAVTARRDSFVQFAIIENSASAKRDKKGALFTYAGAGLQKAINAEAQSMRDYISRKLQERANKYNAH